MKQVPKSQPAPEAVGAPISAAAIKAIDTTDAESLIAEFEGSDEESVHEVEVLGRKFYIRALDILSLIDVETRRLTIERGQIVRRPNREAKLGLSLEFSACLMRRDGDAWAPLFTLETVQKFLSQPRAKALIHQLATEIYRLNPELDPARKVFAAQTLNA